MQRANRNPNGPAGGKPRPARAAKRWPNVPARRPAGLRGAVLVVVVVGIGVAAVIFASALRLAVSRRQRADVEAWRVQAAWLAESALDRAAAQLEADPDYSGETWKITAATFSPNQAENEAGGLVLIEVTAVPGEPRRRSVRVEADYPNDPHHRARRVNHRVIHLTEEEPRS